MRGYLRAAALFLCTISTAQAGAWLQAPGHGQFIAQATYFTSNKYYDRAGNQSSQARYSKYEFMPYLEYGLFKNLTIGGTASLQYDRQGGLDNAGLADPEIFARTSLYKDDVQVVSLQPLAKFRSAFERSGTPRGGSNSTDLELSLLYGRNLKLLSTHDYLDLSVGYRYRSTDLNNQFHADAALGLQATPSLQIIPAIRTIFAQKMSNGVAFSQNGNQDYDLIKLELGARYQLSQRQALGLNLFSHVDGRQTGNGTGVTLSVAQQF